MCCIKFVFILNRSETLCPVKHPIIKKLFNESGIELKVVGVFFNVSKELAQKLRLKKQQNTCY